MPAMLLIADDITRRYGARTVLDGVTLHIDSATRLGIVGPNGSGKTTLLRILAGIEPPDSGTVRRLGPVAALTGTPDPARTVRANLLAATGIAGAEAELERWSARLAEGDLDAIDAHATALQRWLALGGDEADGNLRAAVGAAGLPPALLDRPVGSLSGGQAARVGLAAITLARANVIALDEPSNHLDRAGLTYLRAMLAARAGGFVLVSHDRALLADTCRTILAIDPHTGRATLYDGG